MRKLLALFLFGCMIVPVALGAEIKLKSIGLDEQTGTRLSIIDKSGSWAGTDPCTGGYGNLDIIGEVPVNTSISLEDDSQARSLAERAQAAALKACPGFKIMFNNKITLLLIKGAYNATTQYSDSTYINFGEELVKAPWEVYSEWTRSSPSRPMEYKTFNAAAARAALAKEVIRSISGSEFLFLLGADTKTGVRFWIYSTNRAQKCWAYSGGVRNIIGEVPDNISLLDQELARSLLMAGTQLGIDKCGGFTESTIFLTSTNWKAGDNRTHVQPIKVEGQFGGSQSQKPFTITNYVVQAELQRNSRAAEEKKRMEARTRYDQFAKKYGVTKLPTIQELETNPFTYEGVIIAIKSTFEEMSTATQGVFTSRVSSSFSDHPLVVSGIPRGTFTKKGAVMLAGRVLGKTELKTGLGSIAVPHLTFVGVHSCADSDCNDITSK
jgi:hypothetical protein